MTTATTTITNTGDRLVGAARSVAAGSSRTGDALADRVAGMTWGEIARRHGYRSASVAEHNVGRLVAWLNGNTVATRSATRTALSTRTFGVEVEFSGITMAAAAAAITRALGRQVTTGGYHQSSDWSEWRVDRDGSVTTQYGNGGEAVSPVLRGQDGLDEVARVVAALREAGARVDRRCGVHVHLDARDLTGEQIARLMVAYVDRQDAMDTLVAPSRRRGLNAYCGRMSDTEKLAHKGALEATRTPAPTGYHGRYRTVNVNTLGRTGTVEFRQHQGSLNGTKITAWVKMLLALGESVIATADEALPQGPAELIEALTAHGLDTAAARHLTSRIGR
jgi:hypothetical protein